MNLKTTALRAAVLGALRDLIDGEYTTARAEVLNTLRAANENLGVKTVDITLPDGAKVATATLNDPKPRTTVTDRAAFATWVADHAPTQVTTEPSPVERVIDAMNAAHHHIADIHGTNEGHGPDKNEQDVIVAEHVLAALGMPTTAPPPTVNTDYQTELLDRVIPTTDGQVADPNTGEVVPGITHTPPGQPDRFTLRYTRQGRADIAAAWRNGHLDLSGLPTGHTPALPEQGVA